MRGVTNEKNLLEETHQRVFVSASMKQNPEVKKLWLIVLTVRSGHGFLNGLFLYIWGPFLYDHFSLGTTSQTAMTITMLLFAFRQGLVALLEIPTGALADTIGRGHTTILALAVRSAFFLSLGAIAFCDHVATASFWATIASICYAIGYTLFNGSFSAWCADTMREKTPEVPYAWLATRYIVYESIGELCGAVLSIWLFLNGFSFIPFLVAAVTAYILIGYSVSRLKEPAVLQIDTNNRPTLASVVRDIGGRMGDSILVVKKLPAIIWVVLVFGAYAFLVSLIIHLWPVYLRETTGAGKLSFLWIFVAVLCLVVQTAGARAFVKINDYWTNSNMGSNGRFRAYRRLFTISAMVSAVSIVLLSVCSARGMAPLWLFITTLGVVLLCVGPIWSGFDILVNSLIPAEQARDRATIISAGSLARSALTLLLAVPAGGVSAESSPVGWSIPAIILFCTAVGATVSLRRDEQKRVLKQSFHATS